MTEALSGLWPYVDELFRDDELIEELGPIAVRPSALREDFDTLVRDVLTQAQLAVPEGFVARGGGRHGVHSEYLGKLVAEMHVLARQYPGGNW
jgi:ring-1,2-phenylacetyl-CoA epoxidase subunit PaaC